LDSSSRPFHHADCAFDDALARGDDGAGLLPLQHRAAISGAKRWLMRPRSLQRWPCQRSPIPLEVIGDRPVRPRSDTWVIARHR
jgi:hypothetical protein